MEDLRQFKADLVVTAGDMVNGFSSSRACWDMARSLGLPMLKGNHEGYLCKLTADRQAPEWTSELYSPSRENLKQFSIEEMARMAQLPSRLEFKAGNGFCLTHASLVSERFNSKGQITLSDYESHFSQSNAACIVRGHDHRFVDHPGLPKQVFSIGSVGHARDGLQKAQYAFFDLLPDQTWQMSVRSIDYPHELALEQMLSSGLLERGGVISQLIYYEVKHQHPLLFRFLDFYKTWPAHGEQEIRKAFYQFMGRELPDLKPV